MISVITPVYNGERFIQGCLENVIEQKCPEAEHLLIDGGSTDKTVAIISKYAKRYRHIRWVSEKDQGQSQALNKGLAMSKGEIISSLNVDDFYEPGVLNQILELFKDLPEPSLLVGNCNVWGDEGKILQINKPKKMGITDLLSLKEPFPWNPSAYFYHKSLHQKIGLYLTDEPYGPYMMDIDFIIRAVLVAKVKYIDEIWGNLRLIKGAKTTTLKEKGLHDIYYNQLLERHRQKLSFPLRVLTMIKYILFRKFKVRRISYYFRNPFKIFSLIRRKLKKLK
ncbi:MAG: glycosyltransferase [Candidatus Omnitrophica bacterium]|nr:glycosyltransferase [Candidatus Omnitrophota bacterium]